MGENKILLTKKIHPGHRPEKKNYREIKKEPAFMGENKISSTKKIHPAHRPENKIFSIKKSVQIMVKNGIHSNR